MNYLYNGVELPALPKTDKPCAFIGNPLGYANFWYLYFSDEAPVAPAFVNIPGEYILYQFGKIGGEGSENFTEWTLVENSIDGTSFTGTSLWTNTDILKGDDTLYLAASEPIPILAPQIDPLSMWLGWKAGNWVARQRGKKKEQPEEEKTPIAYLYNGVRLPDINAVWTDKETYPYAYITHLKYVDETDSLDAVLLYLSDTAAYSFSLVDGVYMIPTGSKVQTYHFIDQEIVLGEESESTETYTAIHQMFDESNGYSAVWASADIKGESDEIVYFAASEPVPVYE